MDKGVFSELALSNYPNPFNPSTTISFLLSSDGPVTLRVFDVLGREVATLVNGYTRAGQHQVRFDGTALTSGVYFYKLDQVEGSTIRKMILTK